MARSHSKGGGDPLNRPRILYFGSGAFGVPPLEALHRSGYPIVAVVSQPPKPAHRGMHLTKTPVYTLAESLQLPVLTPARPRDPQFLDQVRALQPDLIVLAAYGKILPPALLQIAPLGNWNLHPSLLPRYRGASPIQYALLNGETETGVTLMEMTDEMDAGDIYLQVAEPIHPDEDAGHLEARLAQRAGDLLLEGLSRLSAGTLSRTPQDHSQATYTRPIEKEDAHIRWDEPAERCANRIRAVSPKPGAYTIFRGKRLKLWRATPTPLAHAHLPGTILQVQPHALFVACGRDALALLEVQPESRACMPIGAFVNGYRPQVGELLG